MPDIAWLLYAAERMLSGARLYRDLIEINPPLIVWLNLIPAWLGRVTGIPDLLLYRLGTVAVALGSTVIVDWEFRRILPQSDGLRRKLVLLVLFILVVLPRLDFGEREHLTLALVLPYLLLIVLRSVDSEIPTAAALGIGILAGIGFAMKPFFALPWLALETYRAAVGRKLRVRPEILAVVLIAASYGSAVLLFSPEYFGLLSEYGRAYNRLMRESLLRTLLFGDWSLVALAGLLAYRLTRRLARNRVLWDAVAVGVAGFLAAAVMQGKGWRYQFYPAFSLAVLALGLVAFDRRPAGGRWQRMALAGSDLLLLAVLAATSIAAVRQALQPDHPRYAADSSTAALIDLVRHCAPDHRVMVLSTYMASTFPLARYAGAESASRFNALWPIAAAYEQAVDVSGPLRYHRPEEMAPYERDTFESVISDLETSRPSMILALLALPDRPGVGLRRISLLDYFLRDARFASILRDYRLLGRSGHYLVFLRADAELSPAAGSGCGLPAAPVSRRASTSATAGP